MRIIITEEEKNHIYRLYNLIKEQFKFTKLSNTTMPIGPNVTDGLITFKAPKEYLLNIRVDAIDIQKNITRKNYDETKNEYSYFITPNIDFDFEIKIQDKCYGKEQGCKQYNDVLKIPINVEKKESVSYLISPSNEPNFKINYVVTQVPPNINFPKSHNELIKTYACVIIDSEVPFNSIDSHITNLTENTNMFRIGNLVFLYLNKGFNIITISFDMDNLEIPFGVDLMSGEKKNEQLQIGVMNYVKVYKG